MDGPTLRADSCFCWCLMSKVRWTETLAVCEALNRPEKYKCVDLVFESAVNSTDDARWTVVRRCSQVERELSGVAVQLADRCWGLNRSREEVETNPKTSTTSVFSLLSFSVCAHRSVITPAAWSSGSFQPVSLSLSPLTAVLSPSPPLKFF